MTQLSLTSFDSVYIDVRDTHIVLTQQDDSDTSDSRIFIALGLVPEFIQLLQQAETQAKARREAGGQ